MMKIPPSIEDQSRLSGGHEDDSSNQWTPRNVIMVATSISGLMIGIINAVQIRIVDDRQIHQVQKSEQRDEQLDNIEKTAEKVEAANGSNLLASYLYLQRLADEEPDNKLAAASAKDARRIYETWLTKQRSKNTEK
jgi:hypothetical protein